MRVSALERLLITERQRPRAATGGGFSVPVMLERAVSVHEEPLLVSNTKGQFVQTRRNSEGMGRYGFFYCPLGQERAVVVRLHAAVEDISKTLGWSNRATTVHEGIQKFVSLRVEPKAIVIPTDVVVEICGEGFTIETAEQAMVTQGFVAEVSGLKVLVAPLLKGTALLTAAPSLVGVYTRVGDYLGLQLCNVRQNIVVVNDVA